MTKRKLRPFVLPVVYIAIVLSVAIGINYATEHLTKLNEEDYDYVINTVEDTTEPVISEQKKTIIRPYTSEDVSLVVDYYSKDDDAVNQQKSLINYSNVYLQNTGVLYGSDKAFDVVSVLDGKVK